ncbi:MAG: T9SS type A sorting domain-containing protein, partial [Ferruginibacter sp.]
LTYTAGTGGTISGTSPQTVACGGNGSTVTAVADACYTFTSWSDGVLTASRTDLNVQNDITVTANFTQNGPYTLTYTAGTGGTISGTSPQTVACGGNGTTVTAVADACYTFTSWSDGVLTASRTDLNVQNDITVTANFTQNGPYTLTYTAGTGGTISGTSPQTVACGGNGSTVTAVADACYTFTSWSDGVLTASRTDLNVQNNITVTANFTQNGPYTLTYTAGTGGTISGTSPQTVACGANGSTVTAVADACYTFTSWSDGVLTASRTDLNVQADITVTANFTQNGPYTLTYTAGTGGTISGTSPQTVACGGNGSTVTAVADACYTFTSWSDGVLTASRTDLNVQNNITVTANFTQNGPYTLTYTAGTGGTITGTSPQTVACGGNGTTVTAVADACYTFTSWSDGVLTASRTDLNVQNNITVTANFTQNGPYTITVTAGANGTITPGTGTVNCGSNATYTITANACYHINDVVVDGVSQGAIGTYTFTNVTATHTISASFALNAPLTAPVVSGPVNVCPYIGNGTQITYSVPVVPGATSYNWTVPVTVTIVSGQGTPNLVVTINNGFTTTPNKQIRISVATTCGTTPQTVYVLVAQSPGTPQPITGPTSVCPIIGTPATFTYTIPSVVGATSYIWTAQAGTTTITHPNGPGPNDTTVNISFTNGFTSSNLTVRAANDSCGASNVRSLPLTRANPATPGLIAGSTNACPYMAPGGTPATYSVPAVAGQTYNWTVPAGAIGLVGQGTNMISFTYPSTFTSGSISVTTTNGCGTSGPRSLSINKLLPARPGVIDVIQTQPCPNRVYTYTISTTPASSTSVQWTVPAGATLVSGQGTTSITVSYPGTSFNSSVTAQSFNNCGSSTIRSTPVSLPTCVDDKLSPTYTKAGSTIIAAPVAEAMKVNVYPNPTVADFKLQVVTADKQTINVRILDAQGRSFKTFELMPYQTINVGAELKAGTYMMEVRQGNEVKVTKLLKF